MGPKTNATEPTTAAHEQLEFLHEDPQRLLEIESLVRQGERAQALNRLEGVHLRDLADLLKQLPFGPAPQLFDWSPPELAGRALADMNPTFCATLLGGVPLPAWCAWWMHSRPMTPPT